MPAGAQHARRGSPAGGHPHPGRGGTTRRQPERRRASRSAAGVRGPGSAHSGPCRPAPVAVGSGRRRRADVQQLRIRDQPPRSVHGSRRIAAGRRGAGARSHLGCASHRAIERRRRGGAGSRRRGKRHGCCDASRSARRLPSGGDGRSVELHPRSPCGGTHRGAADRFHARRGPPRHRAGPAGSRARHGARRGACEDAGVRHASGPGSTCA